MSVPAADNLRHHAPHFTDRPVATRDANTAAALLEAIDALHHPHTAHGETFCCHCAATEWPCPTARLLHPPVPAEETLPNTEVRP